MRCISSFKERVKDAEGKSRILHYGLDVYRHYNRCIRRYLNNARLQKVSRAKTFQDIYKYDRWYSKEFGFEQCDFFSGIGSHADELVNPYVSLIEKLVSEKGIVAITDLGCGDFNIGSKIAPLVDEYTGCDIVPELIERNQKSFGNDRCRFVCLDIVDDDLPASDLCLIREVFQHLSNKEIMRVLPKLRQYKFVLITNTVKRREAIINDDIPHGKYHSVSLVNPPFCMVGKEMLRLNHPHSKEADVVSTLFENSCERSRK